MFEHIGNIIKINRIKQDISQEQLSRGICSISYLSKLENGKIIGSVDMIQPLLKELNLEIDLEEVNQEMQIIKENLNNLNYKLFSGKLNSSDELELDLLANRISKYSNVDINAYYLLVKLRDATIKRSLQSAERIINQIKSIYDQISGYNKSLFCIYTAHKLLIENKHQEAKIKLTEVLSQENVSLERWLKGYLYYLMSLCENHDYRISSCLLYVEKALIIFQGEYYLSRCMDCLMIKGINYLRLNELEKAEESFAICENLLLKEPDTGRQLKVLHNRALILQKRGRNEEAISYLLNTVHMKQELNKANSESLNFSIYVLAKTYYKLHNIEECRKWLSQIEYNPAPSTIHRELAIMNFLCKAEEETEMLGHTAFLIKELKNEKKWNEAAEFCFLIGQKYHSLKQYKKASNHFKSAYLAQSKLAT
ncbi:transcriptional regulator with XRE-family HTH domain [Peribacillus deserti]|uniref:Transcriptional regulator with XRE-family HTH domain n=1 Tax=Peribacillus deserti TaxID=673318 RepID=A0ABS2QN91_9BACI|nr:helix-turn-helix transcriptional regulator [Peribacillus deserti]MBM7694633.1 transcriptional regulator with XRE-family HTH domain [Peribacillus deserti]